MRLALCTIPHHPISQIHLALTGNETEMRISWKTTHAGCPNKVHYDVTPDYLAASATNDAANHTNDDDANATIVSAHGSFADATTVSYSASDMCGAPARTYKYDAQYFQSSILTGLVPGQRYYYRLHGDKHIYSFRAPPPVGPHVHTSFLAYGDMGESTHKSAKAPGYDVCNVVKSCVMGIGFDGGGPDGLCHHHHHSFGIPSLHNHLCTTNYTQGGRNRQVGAQGGRRWCGRCVACW